jgi:hypothetical protein
MKDCYKRGAYAKGSEFADLYPEIYVGSIADMGHQWAKWRMF